MRNSSFNYFLLLLLTLSLFNACKKEEEPLPPTPTVINLSNETIYEQLPFGTAVAFLSTDIENETVRYQLVSGEGDTHNTEFDINSLLLKTRRSLDYEDGATRSIRIRAIAPGGSYEQILNIKILDFEGTYPSLSSTSFEDGDFFPRNAGADHGNLSPDIMISDIPPNTVSMVLAMVDLDFNDSWHWAVWNIDPSKTLIPRSTTWSSSVTEGDNDYGTGYVGPFPPSIHRYQISVYFLDTMLELTPEEYAKIPSETIGHTLARATIVGKFSP